MKRRRLFLRLLPVGLLAVALSLFFGLRRERPLDPKPGFSRDSAAQNTRSEPPAQALSTNSASPPSVQRHQPPELRPTAPATDPAWRLADWTVEPAPGKPGFQLRSSVWFGQGKHDFVRVEEEIEVGPGGQPRVSRTREMVGDQIIVKLPDGSPASAAQALAAKLGGKTGDKPFAPDTWLIELPRKLEAVPEALSGSRSSAIPIDYAEPDFLVRPVRTPNDPRFTNFSQWHLYNNTQIDKDIKAARAWDRRTSALYGGTNGVIVAVIDTGVRYTHEDLAANMWNNPGETAADGLDNDGNGLVDDVYGADFFAGDGDPVDPNDSSHGTRCAGLIAAVGNNGLGVCGVAWNGARIMALRFIDGTGATSDSIKCIDYAIAKGAKVISASYGSESFSATESLAVQRASNAGIIFVAAVGNGGTDFVGDNTDSVPFYPAGYPRGNIIAVGATDRNDNKATFSNFGATSVDLMAPGVEMWSTTTSGSSDSSYNSGQGTSFAAPVVAGAVALLAAEYPADSVSARRGRVVNTNAVDVIPALSGLCVTGGRLNLAKLLPAADPGTLPRALAWHRPGFLEPLINSLMRTPAAVAVSNTVTVYSGVKKFNNTNGVNTSGLVNQTGGWLCYRANPAASWASNALVWHANNGDYQFWKATMSNVPAGTMEYYLHLDFDSGASTTYSYYAANPDGFASGTNQTDAASSPYTFLVPKSSAAVVIGGTNQTFDGSARPVSVGTTPPGLAVAVTYDGNSIVPTNAGTYAVVATIDDPTYEGSATALLTVAKASAEIQLGNLSQTFDGSARPVSIGTMPPGLAVAVTYDGNSSAPTEAGAYSVVAAVDDANYRGSVTNLLTVAKATALVELSDLAQVYDGTARRASVATTPSGLTVDVTYDGGPSAPVNAGSYAVAATINDRNYAGTVEGRLEVAKASATVSLSGLDLTYDGSPKSVIASTVPGGLAVNITYNGSADSPVNAGDYAVLGMIDEANYTGFASEALVINKAEAMVQIGNLSQIHDGSPKSVTVATYPPGLATSVTYDGSAVSPAEVGEYAVAATVTDSNYHGSANATLSITAPPPVSFQSLFGSADPAGDEDGDGVPALAEYALGGTTNGNDWHLLPRISPTPGFALVAVVRTNGTDHLVTQAQASTNLVAGWFAAALPGARYADQDGVPEGFERRVYEFTDPYDSQAYMRLIFTLEPAPQ